MAKAADELVRSLRDKPEEWVNVSTSVPGLSSTTYINEKREVALRRSSGFVWSRLTTPFELTWRERRKVIRAIKEFEQAREAEQEDEALARLRG